MKPTKFRVNGFLGIPHYVEITPESGREIIANVFTAGNCHSFALALNKLRGWKLYACFRDIDGVPNHVFVQNSRGNFVDIEGERTLEEFQRSWRGEIRPITIGHIRTWVHRFNKEKCGYIPTRVKESLPYAEKFLAGGLK